MTLSCDLNRSYPVICTSNRNKLLRLVSGETSVKCNSNNFFILIFLYKAIAKSQALVPDYLNFNPSSTFTINLCKLISLYYSCHLRKIRVQQSLLHWVVGKIKLFNTHKALRKCLGNLLRTQ